MLDDALVVRRSENVLPVHRAQEVVAAAFHYRRIGLLAFIGLLLGGCLVALLIPLPYLAEMTLLVKGQRLYPSISAEQNVQQVGSEAVTEEQINSEVELLRSEDVLRNVVLRAGLYHPVRSVLDLRPLDESAERERTIAKQVQQLHSNLRIEPISKTYLIKVGYRSSDPETAARVLNVLSEVYIEKHVEVHRLPGRLKFFEEQVENSRRELEKVQANMQTPGLVAASLLRDNTVQRLGEFKSQYEQTMAAVKETEQRIQTLQQQLLSTPERVVTTSRKSENAMLMQDLKGKLVTLELRRLELLTKYQPEYRSVQEIEREIADVRVAIQREENEPVRDESTDQNPTHAWIRSELAKAKTELAGLKSRSQSLVSSIQSFQRSAEEFSQQTVTQQALQRDSKKAEETYLLYVRKRDEARIAEELDNSRILNVAVVKAAEFPTLPVRSRKTYLLAVLLMALVGSGGIVYLAYLFDESLGTPEQVSTCLGVPILATLPSGQKPLKQTNLLLPS